MRVRVADAAAGAMIDVTKIEFVDKPADYPVLPRSESGMVSPPPERLRVGLHLQALGVYEILGDGEVLQPDLWRTVEYRRVSEGVPNSRIAARYEVVRP